MPKKEKEETGGAVAKEGLVKEIAVGGGGSSGGRVGRRKLSKCVAE